MRMSRRVHSGCAPSQTRAYLGGACSPMSMHIQESACIPCVSGQERMPPKPVHPWHVHARIPAACAQENGERMPLGARTPRCTCLPGGGAWAKCTCIPSVYVQMHARIPREPRACREVRCMCMPSNAAGISCARTEKRGSHTLDVRSGVCFQAGA